MGAAHSVAHTEIIRRGQVWEQDVIYRAIEGALRNWSKRSISTCWPNARTNVSCLKRSTRLMGISTAHYHRAHLKPLLDYLKKQNRVVPLSEMSDHFAFSQVHPWHLESACEWLERKGLLEKVSAPFKLTKRSLERVEEPAYFFNS